MSHLKKSGTGHLLKSSAGHLVNECAAACNKSASDDFNYVEETLSTNWWAKQNASNIWRASGTRAQLVSAGGTGAATNSFAVYDQETFCPGEQQATAKIYTNVAGAGTAYPMLHVAGDEQQPAGTRPNDVWEYNVNIGNATGAWDRYIRKVVNGVPSFFANTTGPGNQSSWAMRIRQSITDVGNEIRVYDAATIGTLVQRGTVNDTDNSAADNIYVGIMGDIGIGVADGKVIEMDDWEVVTP